MLSALEPRGGILFACNSDGRQKAAARQKVIDLFKDWHGSLRMLTMPGIHWKFERLLLHSRRARKKNFPVFPTHFTCIENDPALYSAAVVQMPGGRRKVTDKLFTSRFVSFCFADVDDFIQYKWKTKWDAAWLDYNGALTTKRLDIIRDFFNRAVRSTLIVTTASRHSSETLLALDGEILHNINYFDTSVIKQIAIRHHRPLWHWQ
jgi:hypothetical protein